MTPDLIFNPYTGQKSPGQRFTLRLGGIPVAFPRQNALHAEQEIPVTMREDPLVQSLLATSSLHDTARALALTPEQVAERFFRLRCLHDFPYWAACLVRIKRKGGGEDVPFILNKPQRHLVETFESMRCAGKPIRLVLLKARQWGGSTCTQLYMAWLQMMHAKGLNSLIIAHQGAGSEEIKDMFDRMIEAYPADMLADIDETPDKGPKTKNAGRSGLAMRIPARNCKVKIGSAERPDSCRGGDYNLVHLSEVGIWKKTQGKCPEDIVRSACSGVLLQPLTMIVMESTANGTGTFFHREYLAAARGESQFKALFIPWYEIEAYQLPLSPEEEEQLRLRIERGKESDADTSRAPSGRYLRSLYDRGVSLPAIAWYLQERSKYSDQAQMAAEYPTDDVEAFAHSGARVFDRTAVERMRGHCCAPKIVGEVISDIPDGRPGCVESVRFVEGAQGGLRVWSPPADARQYVADRYLVVVDVGGRSAKADWSVITVIDRIRMAQDGPPEIVAQWRGHSDIDLLAWNAARIAAWYHDALLVIESNTMESRDRMRWVEGDQAPFILRMIREEYYNLYERASNGDEIREGRPSRLGFHTNVSTKPAIISNLVKMVRENAYIEHDEEALDELITYERRPDGSYGAIMGAHDDMLMTRAIGLFISRYEMPLPAPLPHSQQNSCTPYTQYESPYSQYRRRQANATESTLF